MKAIQYLKAENRKLKGELEKLKKVEKKAEIVPSHSASSEGQINEKGEKRMSFVQVSKLFNKL